MSFVKFTKLKVSSKQTLLTIVFVVVGVFLALFLIFVLRGFDLFVDNQTQSSLALVGENIKEQEQMIGLPVRLKIPAINVDSAVEYVGLDSGGAMNVPEDPANVAWFKLGQRPGENGAAVIAGHYGWKDGKAAAFDNLYKLRKGDKVYIEDDKGAVISFVVRESRRYEPKADASAVFESNDGKAHLNLVTCEGDWNEASKSYSKRLVVFADKE